MNKSKCKTNTYQVNNVCTICNFDFPFSKHLGYCSNCCDGGLQTIQVCKGCSMDDKDACPVCYKDVLTWNQDFVHIDKMKINMLGQFRMVIPCLLYVIGLPKKYGTE